MVVAKASKSKPSPGFRRTSAIQGRWRGGQYSDCYLVRCVDVLRNERHQSRSFRSTVDQLVKSNSKLCIVCEQPTPEFAKEASSGVLGYEGKFQGDGKAYGSMRASCSVEMYFQGSIASL